MTTLLVIGLGGFLGAIARYGLSGWVQGLAGGTFPVGTLAVNALGCLAIGVLVALVEDGRLFAPATRTFVQIGLLGSFTTFSTLGYETVELLRDGDLGLALGNVAANVLLGVTAVAVGRALIR